MRKNLVSKGKDSVMSVSRDQTSQWCRRALAQWPRMTEKARDLTSEADFSNTNKQNNDSTMTPVSGSETDIYVFFSSGANRSANRRGPSIKVPAHSPDLYDPSHAGLVNLLSQYRSKLFWFESYWTQNYNSSFWFPCRRCGILLRPSLSGQLSLLSMTSTSSATALSHT
jgi:hypothetical protein